VVLEQIVRGWTKIPAGGKWRSRVADTRGQAFVEFAFVLPVLVLLTIAAVDFGLVLRDWIQVTNTAGAAARAAAVSRVQGQTTLNAGGNFVRSAGFACPGNSCVSLGSDTVTVTVSKPWSVGIPFLPSLGGTMTSDATEKVE
jgi:Flp pilus assembly protein TadG